MNVVSVINHKGGVGKTTFTGSIAQALSISGFKVLAIDNDSQHNLSTMLGTGVMFPCITDVYNASLQEAPSLFLKSIRTTGLDNLHIIPSSNLLSESVVKGSTFLKDIIEMCKIDRFYDYCIIDNAPGLDRLQQASITASTHIFVPTELKQFAVDGIVEMERIILTRFQRSSGISRIIPNFYRNTLRQNSFYNALTQLFPGKVTTTMIPVDQVFDELITEGKILFLHKLYSKGAAYYLKLMHELFDLDEDALWEAMVARRTIRLREDARKRTILPAEKQH